MRLNKMGVEKVTGETFMSRQNDLEAFDCGCAGGGSASRTSWTSARPRHIAMGMVLLSFVSAPFAFGGPKSMPFIPSQGSTSPSSPFSADLNPYGLAVVPKGFPLGIVKPGELLVSNFNNSAADGNIQGEGSTIVIMDPDTGQQTGVFFAGKPPIGFTNALVAVKQGFVFAGSVFTTDASSPGQNGGLLVIDRTGTLLTTITSGTNGPWGLAINERERNKGSQLFISNVLDGTITRIEVSFKGGFSTVGTPTTIASGYEFGLDALGLVVGPAGLAYDRSQDILYVAAEDDNQIYEIDGASRLSSSGGKGKLIFSDQTRLHGPLGLIIAPNGNLITANADPKAHLDPTQPSELVEFTTGGMFVRQFSIDPSNGSAFALLNVPSGNTNLFAYVDDSLSILNIMRFAK
jgi:hypothetical protein